MTLDGPDAALAREVVAIVAEVEGENLVGIYLHGSAVAGGLRATSDLDLVALVRAPTRPQDRRAIVRRLLEISGRRAYRGPARPVELTVVRADQVRPWHDRPIVELVYGEWLRDDLEAGDLPKPSPSPYLAPEVTVLRARGTALVGPPPANVFGPVPVADLRRSVVAGVPGLLDDLASDTRNVILTLARVWFTLETGEVAPKDVAADWVIERLAPAQRGVLARARDLYLEGRDARWEDELPAVRALAEQVVGEIDRLAAESDRAGPT